MKEEVDLSIVILTWNSHRFIVPCLTSLQENLRGLEYEVIVIDNGSTDGSATLVRREWAGVNLVENRQNRGVAAARNQGLRAARGRQLLLLDVDTVLHHGSIKALVGGMNEDPSIGLLGPRLVGHRGELQYSCRNLPTLLSKLYRQLPPRAATRRLRHEEMRDWDHLQRRYVPYVIGACQLIRRSAMEDVGFLDERMFYGVEEIDYCVRIWRRGWKVMYFPDAVVTHCEQRASRRQVLGTLQRAHLKSLIVYFLKYRYCFTPPELGTSNGAIGRAEGHAKSRGDAGVRADQEERLADFNSTNERH
jgi:N-acetylglucosaminyl-diphospho-decaprenol L-rhamnosyltransferase